MNFFEDVQNKKSSILLMISIILISLCSVCSYKLIDHTMSERILREEAILIGKVASIDESLAREVISVLVKGKYDEGLEKKGLRLLEGCGYKRDTIRCVKPISPNKNLWFIGIIAIVLILIAKEYLNYKTFYGEVHKVNIQLGRIINGDYSLRLEDTKEGAFYVMNKNINKFLEILNKSILGLQKEKTFLKEIISDISHQLKTPLSTLSIYNELLQGNLLDKGEQEDILENSRTVLDRMEWLVKNLLKIAMFEVNVIKFNREKTNIRDVIMKAIEALDGDIRENNNIINMFSGDVELYIDRQWVEEGFINIIKNAIEHSKVAGVINIRLEDNTVFTRVVVEDFGEGIEEKNINKIFKRFYKSKNSNKNSIGIGLALSKNIFEGNGGNISVKSILGKGTKFMITFTKI